MVKLADTPDLGSGAARCVGSSPILGIFLKGFFNQGEIYDIKEDIYSSTSVYTAYG